MRVLFVPLYSYTWASSRYRAYHWADALEKEGFRCTVLPPPHSVVSRFGYFLRLVVMARRCNVIFIQKKLLPTWLLRVLHVVNPYIVFDFDDALFAKPSDARDASYEVQSAENARRFEEMLRTVRLVVCGNRYLQSYASQFNTSAIVVPTCIDLDRLPPRPPDRAPGDRVVLGWIGRRATLTYLRIIEDVMRDLEERAPGRFVLRIVADRVDTEPFEIPGVTVENIVWTLASEYSVIDGFDIGIMPLTDDPWAMGKCGFKILQYMSRGVPTVASPVGVNREIIEDGVNGFLADERTEWVAKLLRLAEDPNLRREQGAAGFETVRDSFSFRANLPGLAGKLTELSGAPRPHEES